MQIDCEQVNNYAVRFFISATVKIKTSANLETNENNKVAGIRNPEPKGEGGIYHTQKEE